MSTSLNTQVIIALFSKLLDLILSAINSYKAKKKQEEVDKIKSDAVSSFIETFNPTKKQQ